MIPGQQPRRAHARNFGILMGIAGSGDDGCRDCKIAWYHPVALTQAAGRGEMLANDQGVNLFFGRIDMKTV